MATTRRHKPAPLPPEPKQAGIEFVPTAEQRQLVKALGAYGINQDRICLMVLNPETGKPISENTLRKHFEFELAVGSVEVDAGVMETLLRLARGAPAQFKDGAQIRAEQAPVPACTIFWAKTRLGMRERIDLGITHQFDLTRLSEAELDVFEQLARKAAVSEPGRNTGRAPATSH